MSLRTTSLLVVLALTVAACGGETDETTTTTEPAPAAFETYDSSQLGFAISYPSGWEVEENITGGIVTFVDRAQEGELSPNFNVVTGEVDPEIPPVAYYEGEPGRLRNNLPDVEILETADVNVDGVIGRGITFTTLQADIEVGVSRLIVLNEGRAYEITFFAEIADLDRLTPTVQTIFQSFEFRP